MNYCGIGGFESVAEVAGMAGFMTAVCLMILLLILGAIGWAGRSIYELIVGAGDQKQWLWLVLSLNLLLAGLSLALLAAPQTFCLWGAM